MPEAAVDEDGEARASENDIGFAAQCRQGGPVEPVTEAESVQARRKANSGPVPSRRWALIRRCTASVEAKGWRQRSGTESDLTFTGGPAYKSFD